MKKIFMFLCTCLLLISCGSNNNNTKKKLTKEEVANVYNNIATYMNDLTNNNSPKNIHRKYQESNDYSTLDSTKAMIKWAEYLYKNETFVYSEEFVQFKTTIDNNTLKMYWLTEMDIENNKFYTTLFYTSIEEEAVSEEDEMLFFMYFDVDYVFDTDTILGFEIRQAFSKINMVNIHFKYEDNKFYIYEPSYSGYVNRRNSSSSSVSSSSNTSSNSEYISSSTSSSSTNNESSSSSTSISTSKEQSSSRPLTIDEETIIIMNKYLAKLDNAIIIDQDYSKEYEAAMKFAFGENY